MGNLPNLHHLTSIFLNHKGDCNLIGVTWDLQIYAEETYQDEERLAQHVLQLNGEIVASMDKGYNEKLFPNSPEIPSDIIKPQSAKQTLALNFSGARYRGLREEDRIADLVQPLSLEDKFNIIERMQLDLSPSKLLGIAESYVLAEAQLGSSSSYVVCRRVRLVYALEYPEHDDEGLPYDYDNFTLYLAHLYDTDWDGDISLSKALMGLPGVKLYRPGDCLVHNKHLFVTDSSDGLQASAIHVWRIEQI